MPKPIYTFYDECAVNPCKSRSAFHAAKLQLFHKPARGMEKILLQRIVFGCFLHELPLMYHELSLIVCFTRIAINVPRIVINCFGGITSGCGWLQQPCHPHTGMCGAWDLWLRPGIVIRLNMKTRHCISGCGRAVPSGL